MRPIVISGGNVLTPDGFAETNVAIADGRIMGSAPADGDQFNAEGLLVLPGIVDLHGDAFERQIQPRPGIAFPIDLALQDTERQLLANGITTAFHGVTLSWEPGLRSRETWRALLDGLAAERWTCDMRVHLRWEEYNLAALDMALADIEAGRVHLLAFNDHTPSILRRLDDPVKTGKYSERGGVSLEEFRVIANNVATGAADIPAARARLAEAAVAAGLKMASHDDDTADTRARYRALGAGICEFPMEEAVAVAARAAGDAVVMGSPNVVRGGSHLGWASAARLAEAGLCTVLSSDYFYPCMLRAPFVLASRGVLDLAAAWALVSANPATAAGLSDRGHITPGARGDVILVDASGPNPRLVTTLAGGRFGYVSGDAAGRM